MTQAAGLTKGGLQYHFASKGQLLTGLLENLLGRLDAELENLNGQAWLEAYVSLILGKATHGDGAVAAIISTLPPGDPHCEPFDRFSKKCREKANASGLDQNLAQIIRLAADGQWLERSFGTSNDADTQSIRKKLLQLIRENAK